MEHNSPIKVLPLPDGAEIKKDFLKKSPLSIASFCISLNLKILDSNRTLSILSSQM